MRERGEQLQTMLNYTNELALPNISNFTKHSEEAVHDGGVVEGRVTVVRGEGKA